MPPAAASTRAPRAHRRASIGRAIAAGGDGSVAPRRTATRTSPERVVVEPRLHRGDAVAERAEHRDLRGPQQDVAVRVLDAHGRTPDHAHGLVRRLRHLDEVLGQVVAHRRERARDRADQHGDVGVGHERVEDLAAALVADRVAAVVDRVGHPQVARDPFVERLLRRVRQRRHVAARRRRTGRPCARPSRPRSRRCTRRLRSAAWPRARAAARCRAVRRGRRRG